MQRRKFIAGMGSLAAAGAAGIGTGAFSSVQANRTVSIETHSDSDAFLAFETSEATNSAYASNASSGAVSFNLDDAATPTGGGSGVNEDGTTQINDIVKVRNQGTQPVLVYVDPNSIDSADRTTSSGFGIDPQATNRPNGDFTDTSGISGGVGDDQISLTGLYTDPPYSYSSYGSGENDRKEEFLLDAGEAFDFGLYVNVGDSSEDKEVSMTITADATVVPDAIVD